MRLIGTLCTFSGKMDLIGVQWSGVDWMHVHQWRYNLNTIILNHWIRQKACNLLTVTETTNTSRGGSPLLWS